MVGFQSSEDGDKLCGIDEKADELGKIEAVDEKGFEHETVFVLAEAWFDKGSRELKKFLSELCVKRLSAQIRFMNFG